MVSNSFTFPNQTGPFVVSADQMGVELGKVLAKKILAQLGKPEDVKGHDSSVSIHPSDRLI
jgi:hypothetical protein